MRAKSRNLTPALAALVLLSLIAATLSPGLHVSAAPSAPAASSLHQLHFAYDKATGRQVDDPTVQIATSASENDGFGALQARKQEQVDPTRITFRSGITIHPEAGMGESVRQALSAGGEASRDKLWLIQFSYPFPTEARARLQEVGVAFYDYVDICTFFARVPPAALPLLDEMLGEGLIRYVGSVPPEAKVQRALAVEAARLPTTDQDIIVLTFGQPTAAQIERLGQWMAIEGQTAGPVPFAQGTSTGAALLRLADLEFVRWVEEQSEAELANLDGGMGVAGDLVRAAAYDGSGVQVMVADSGIARDGSTYHPDLQANRILDQWNFPADSSDATDNNYLGHGTHVAGTIAGKHNPADPISNESYQGMAPGASLLIYKLFGPLSSFEVAWFNDALLRATSGGRTAHVSSNSWGKQGSNGDYTVASEFADAAVRGEYNGQPVSIVAAAMNDDMLVRSPGTGKNVITVGAVKDGNYPDGPLPEPSYDCDPDDWPPGERLCFSNYGPIDTDDDGALGDAYKRVKPDLVAPGAVITSAVPWYITWYGGAYYGSLAGTSQATPHVTGAIAQLLEAYPEAKDWPEMVKAMLLAAAVNVGGNTDYYGHGLLDAYHAILHEPGIDEPMKVWGSSFSASGEIQDGFSFYVPPGYEEVRLVLTWADPVSSTEVINDLDVVAIRDGGGTWRENAIHTVDDTVEYVRIPGHWYYPPGIWRVRVKAQSLADPPQPFALAAHVILENADLSIRAAPASAPGVGTSFVPGGEFYLHQYISNSGYTAGGSYAQLHVTDGFTVTGVTVFTGEGYRHWYEASELYHDPASPDDWHVVVGETIASSSRHVRWSIEIDAATECGSYTFQSSAHWLEAGEERSSSTVNTRFPVACHFVYLPLVVKEH